MPLAQVISYSCSRCKRPLEVDGDLAGKKAACPHCGSVAVVPPRSIRPDGIPIARAVRPPGSANDDADEGETTEPVKPKHDRAEALGLPPDSGPEVPVLTVHPATFQARPHLALVIILLLVGGLGSALYLVLRDQRTGAWACFILALIGATWWGYWKLSTLTVSLIITNKRVTARRGLISKSTREALHDQIQDLQVQQTFWQRLHGVGTIGIASSAEAGVEIRMDDLPNPRKIRETIDAYRNIG
jgi:DNA-directed RNA polymerase subunit RPC12/RpoP